MLRSMMPAGLKPPVHLTPKAVQERCLRMWKHNQWKQLHAFCVQEPRARTFVAARRQEISNLNLVDVKLQELFKAVAAIPAQAPQAVPVHHPAPVDLPEIPVEVDSVSFDFRPESEPEGYSVELTHDVSEVVESRMPDTYVHAMQAGDHARAATILSSFLNTLMPGEQAPLSPLEFRDLMAHLALLKQFPLLVQLCSKMPERITGPAMMDLGAALRVGALLQEPAQWFQEANRAAVDLDTRREVDAEFVQAARSALGMG